jgi:hypothetical protein
MRLWNWLRREQPQAREIEWYRIVYDDKRRVVMVVSDGSRWAALPGTQVAEWMLPCEISMLCGRELLSEGIEGIEVGPTLDYTEERELVFTDSEGAVWSLTPDTILRCDGRATFHPRAGELIEEGVV